MLNLYTFFRHVSPLACLKCVPLLSEVSTNCLCIDWLTKVCSAAKLHFLPCIWISNDRVAFWFTMPLCNFVVKFCYRICLLFWFYADPSPSIVIKLHSFKAWNNEIPMLMFILNDQMGYTFITHCLHLLMTKEQEKNLWYSGLLATAGVNYEIHTLRHQFIFSAAEI